MLGIGCPDRHALPRITSSKMRRPRRGLPSRASGFVLRPKAVARAAEQFRALELPVAKPPVLLLIVHLALLTPAPKLPLLAAYAVTVTSAIAAELINP
jgi:hypothetical protein